MRSSIITLAVFVLLAIAAAVRAQEIVTVSTRDGVTQSFLLTIPADGKATAVAVLFPGGPGLIRLRTEEGRIRFGEGNFLVRTRQQFVDRGVAAAVMDAPSDQPRGMDDLFRLGDKHALDVARVSEEIKRRFPGLPVFLVGTSRGTVSAAAAARALGDSVAGVVLTSSLFIGARAGPGLSGFDYTKIKAPVLLVHHAEDGCKFTPYHEARRLAEARQYPLITVSGGKSPTSDPCEAFSAHGYLGKETETVDAIVNWMLKKPYPTSVD